MITLRRRVADDPIRLVGGRAVRHGDALDPHPDVPCAVRRRAARDARRALMKNDIVHRDGGLAAVVDDPVVADDVGYPAAGEVHVDAELGLEGRIVHRVGPGRVARGEDSDAGRSADSSLRPDDNPPRRRRGRRPPYSRPSRPSPER